MARDQIRTELDGGVFYVTFARPEKKNAFTLGMYEGLVAALNEADESPKVRCVVFRGEGGVFTAGNDLADFMQDPPKGEDSPVFRFLMGIVNARKPLIAQVEGPAIGVGTTMLLHMDLVYAAESAKLRLPFVSLGLVPEGASSVLLPRLAGALRANELLLFGDAFGPDVGREIGLVNEVVPDAELAATVRTRAEALAQKPIGALIDTKRLIRDATRREVSDALRREGAKFVERLTSPEAAEAFQAFFEKREPDFSKFEA